MKVTVISQGLSRDYFFNKPTIIIGRSDSGSEDLSLEDASFQPDHLKIVNNHGNCTIFNQIHDPFTTINGRPFGRRELKKGDRIEVGSTEIIFQGVLQKTENNDELSKLNPSTEKSIGEKEGQNLNEEVGRSSEEKDPEPTFSLQKEADVETIGMTADPKSKYFASRNFLGVGLLGLAIVIFIGCSILYEIVWERSQEQEVKAAQGIADVAMSLAYSQLNQITPHHHNWSDTEFLRESLNQLLPDSYTPLFDLDADGAFRDDSYILRVYTSTDLSQFILIAQPAPNFYNWLIPKSTLLLDSKEMIIRKTKNLREINRLLANLPTLENVNAHELSHLIGKEEIVPLSFLADEIEHREFIPPRELTYLKRNAENYIYNAPRYYKLGELLLENLMKQYGSIETNLSEPESTNPLIERFDNLKDFVVYIPGGVEVAMQIQNKLGTIHKKELLLGYLTFHPENQGVDASNLLPFKESYSSNREGLSQDISLNSQILETNRGDGTKINATVLSEGDPLEEMRTVERATLIEERATLMEEGIVSDDVNVADRGLQPEKSGAQEDFQKDLIIKDPLKEELLAIARQRSDALLPLEQCIVALLKQNNEKKLPYFSEMLQTLIKLYEKVDQYQNEQVNKAIPSIISKYATDEQIEREIQFQLRQIGFEDYKDIQTELKSFPPKIHLCVRPIAEVCMKQAIKGYEK